MQQLHFSECILKEIIAYICRDLATRVFSAALFMIAKQKPKTKKVWGAEIDCIMVQPPKIEDCAMTGKYL